jgi:phosphatidylinositol-3-phosphatase
VLPAIKTAFVIVLENHNWADIKGNASAPYLNLTLLRQGAHAEQYFTPPGLHPSEPNYIWLEAGDNVGLKTDADPSARHSVAAGTDHLVAQLERAGKSWRSYQEDIVAGTCPVKSAGLYAAKRNPMVFFQDVSGSPPSASNAACASHIRPLSELAPDLTADKEADYNFIVPNLCNDSHGASGCPSNLIKTADDWLATFVPKILASEAYKDDGAIFITWDESVKGDHPIGMIALSPFASRGHASNVHYTHSSTLRTVEEIFGLPKLRDAANASDLADLFAASAAGGPTGGVGPDGHARPSPTLTPGAVLTTSLATICTTGYSRTVRNVSAAEKAQVAAAYAFGGPSSSVEYDHLISLELGGSNDPTNVWLEPIADAHVKDGLEAHLRAAVCAGTMNLADVQTRIATDWVKLWNDVGRP